MTKQDLKDKVEHMIPLFEKRKVYVGERFDEDEEPFPDRERQEKFMAITEKGKKKAISIPSSQYELVQTRSVFKNILDKLPENTTGKVHHYRARGKSAMKLFPNDQKTGIWIVNSVDRGMALRATFVKKTEEGDIHIPKDKVGYSRMHKGDVETDMEDLMDVLSKVDKIWENIVDDIASKEVDEDDLEKIENIIGEKAFEEVEDKIDNWKIAPDGSKSSKNPSFWKLITWSINAISERNYSSEIHKEEKIRGISTRILALSM